MDVIPYVESALEVLKDLASAKAILILFTFYKDTNTNFRLVVNKATITSLRIKIVKAELPLRLAVNKEGKPLELKLYEVILVGVFKHSWKLRGTCYVR